ncbi:hypothetical protein Avbf_14672 [Armadillidium vulgare]|nr:hypothetical protein Avbf_14672 [Armadillidium vulgare]
MNVNGTDDDLKWFESLLTIFHLFHSKIKLTKVGDKMKLKEKQEQEYLKPKVKYISETGSGVKQPSTACHLSYMMSVDYKTNFPILPRYIANKFYPLKCQSVI